MKYLLLFLISFLLSTCFSQDTIVSYFDVKWKKATVEDAKYKRLIFRVKEDHYQVEDYLKNGQPIFKGQFKSDKVKNPFGEFINYDEQGTIREVYYFDDNGNLDQQYLVYNENGVKDSERFYSHGKKDGLWKWYYDNGSICWFEQWRNDTLVMLQQFSTEGKEYKDLFNLSIAPKWNYEKKDLSQYLQDKLGSNSKGAPSTIVLLVFVSSDGKIQRVDSKTKVDHELMNSIEQILINGPVWLPALNRLRPTDGVLEVEITL